MQRRVLGLNRLSIDACTSRTSRFATAALGRGSACLCAASLALVAMAASCGDDGSGLPPIDPDAEAPDTSTPPDAAPPPRLDGGQPSDETLLVARVVPGHGTYRGGQLATVRGTGFVEGMTIAIGGREVQAPDIELIDSRRVAIITPAGAPGPADVTVRRGDDEATLPDGYVYDAIDVAPASGSVAGGTEIVITGQGTSFSDGDTVEVGGEPCEDVVVESPTVLRCRVPAGPIGTVTVVVHQRSDGSDLEAPDAFSYYDSTDPFGGGLGGGALDGTLNVTALNAYDRSPVEGAFVIVGTDLATTHQGYTSPSGQVTFSGPDLRGQQTVTIAKACGMGTTLRFESTSVVFFDARDVTVFLVPTAPCVMGDPPPGASGPGRRGAYINGELIWRGPDEFGPNPWTNVPDPVRDEERKVAYVFTTWPDLDGPLADPSVGGTRQIVLESELGSRGYPYRIFAAPGGFAVYALAGLENTATGRFTPYIMGVARNVLAGPGEEVEETDLFMDIPLDHQVEVALADLPGPGRSGPDRFKVESFIDLGGEGIIAMCARWDFTAGSCSDVRPVYIQRERTAASGFMFPGQPALDGALWDARYIFRAGWYTGDYDGTPQTVRLDRAITDVAGVHTIGNFLGLPRATSPAYGEPLDESRVVRWESDGVQPDLQLVLVSGGDGSPAWRLIVRGDVREVTLPDLSSIPGVEDIAPGYITWSVYAIQIPGFDFDEFSYRYLNDRFWSGHAIDVFLAQL